ncbi:hypothetical protein TWF106_005732 [Orbilia oligospora]|uniref:Uncharacterized protein n=1 Tax=Orbilia oligospora TaxID=2813651 RepID=A0A7C8TYN9_ORBOL|nr:hypothetical protein TWF788_005768 [Orbilia oligospora]KAF3195096.1 hypothetical protein TWF106_005732 [Orbilia oligospora]
MQIKSLIAVAIVGLSPIVSATAFTCPSGKNFYCCSNSSPIGGNCLSANADVGCPNTGPLFHACCYLPGIDCVWATVKPAGVFTCRCP